MNGNKKNQAKNGNGEAPLTVVSEKFKLRRDAGVYEGIRRRACRNPELIKIMSEKSGMTVEEMSRVMGCGGEEVPTTTVDEPVEGPVEAPVEEPVEECRVVKCITPGKGTLFLVPRKQKAKK
jgi:hypothetical protein